MHCPKQKTMRQDARTWLPPLIIEYMLRQRKIGSKEKFPRPNSAFVNSPAKGEGGRSQKLLEKNHWIKILQWLAFVASN